MIRDLRTNQKQLETKVCSVEKGREEEGWGKRGKKRRTRGREKGNYRKWNRVNELSTGNTYFRFPLFLFSVLFIGVPTLRPSDRTRPVPRPGHGHHRGRQGPVPPIGAGRGRKTGEPVPTARENIRVSSLFNCRHPAAAAEGVRADAPFVDHCE
jgi:hypothetical protein